MNTPLLSHCESVRAMTQCASAREARMTERPILFSGPMVRAILAGTKTQTRRVLKVEPPPGAERVIRPFHDERLHWAATDPHDMEQGQLVLGEAPRCPYGQPGDRLWVREAWSPDPINDGTWSYTAWAGCRDGQIAGVPERFRHPRFCNYAADWLHGPIRWTPSIHMPRWASRITLEVEAVRVERLQDISDDDSLDEGIYPTGTGLYPGSPRAAFHKLWESINGPGSWDANPWVRAITFRRIAP